MTVLRSGGYHVYGIQLDAQHARLNRPFRAYRWVVRCLSRTRKRRVSIGSTFAMTPATLLSYAMHGIEPWREKPADYVACSSVGSEHRVGSRLRLPRGDCRPVSRVGEIDRTAVGRGRQPLRRIRSVRQRTQVKEHPQPFELVRLSFSLV